MFSLGSARALCDSTHKQMGNECVAYLFDSAIPSKVSEVTSYTNHKDLSVSNLDAALDLYNKSVGWNLIKPKSVSKISSRFEEVESLGYYPTRKHYAKYQEGDQYVYIPQNIEIPNRDNLTQVDIFADLFVALVTGVDLSGRYLNIEKTPETFEIILEYPYAINPTNIEVIGANASSIYTEWNLSRWNGSAWVEANNFVVTASKKEQLVFSDTSTKFKFSGTLSVATPTIRAILLGDDIKPTVVSNPVTLTWTLIASCRPLVPYYWKPETIPMMIGSVGVTGSRTEPFEVLYNPVTDKDIVKLSSAHLEFKEFSNV